MIVDVKNQVNSKANSNIKWRNTIQWNNKNKIQNKKIPPKLNWQITVHNIDVDFSECYNNECFEEKKYNKNWSILYAPLFSITDDYLQMRPDRECVYVYVYVFVFDVIIVFALSLIYLF